MLYLVQHDPFAFGAAVLADRDVSLGGRLRELPLAERTLYLCVLRRPFDDVLVVGQLEVYLALYLALRILDRLSAHILLHYQFRQHILHFHHF